MKQAVSPLSDALKQRLVDAMRLHAQGQREAAQKAYEALLAEWPEQPDILNSLGIIHLQAQEWKTAEDYFRRALAVSPRELRFLLPLARALAAQDKPEAAMDVLAQALTVNPDSVEAMNLLYEISLPLTKGTATCPGLDCLIATHPNIIPLHAVAAKLCRGMNDHAIRLPHLEILYNHGVRDEDFYRQYGVTLRDNGQFDRCLTLCEEALVRYPDSRDLHKLHANILLILGRGTEALNDWSWIVSRHPEDYQAQFSIGIVKLLTSDGKEGYEEYAAHREQEIAAEGFTISIPEWRGEPLAGKRLLLWSSQGIGDVIMFAGLLPWVIAQGAEVTLAVYPKLIPLFRRSFPDVRVIPYGAEMFASGHDFQILLGQLMHLALPHYIPAEHPPFLKADAEHAARLREKYKALSPAAKKRVGISWYTANPDTFSQRNIPLSQWRPLFELPQVQYISLQYGNHAPDIAAINQTFPGKLHADPAIDIFEDIDALAAQIAALDEVISIDNATVHLAGALGVRTTLLLSTASEWRWGLERNDSRWYASVHIERQEKLLDWKPVIARVRDQLNAV